MINKQGSSSDEPIDLASDDEDGGKDDKPAAKVMGK